MKRQKKKPGRGKRIKRKIESFVKDETGKIAKDKILKVGAGVISALGTMSYLTDVSAQAFHTSSLPDDPVETCENMPQNHFSY